MLKVIMLENYFIYEKTLGKEIVIPTLTQCNLSLNNKSILDVGCGHGGVLEAMAEGYSLSNGLGIDTDEEMLAQAKQQSHAKLDFKKANFFTFDHKPFDAIFMRDVLEHIIDPEKALNLALSLLQPGGFVYLSYSPFYSPFGGHQQNGAGFFANVPWLQLFPEKKFRKLLHMQGNSYKSAQQISIDIDTVWKTKLSVLGFKNMLRKLPVKILLQEKHLFRPDYFYKFGLPTCKLPNFYVPLLTELLCTGETVIFQKN